MHSIQTAMKSSMPRRAFFLDSENGVKQALTGLEKLTSSDTVCVFHRNNFSKDCKTRLENCPARVEWITCAGPSSKNSMDFQIVSEFSMQLAAGAFDHGYILSRDQGYLPALNYLAKTPEREGRILALAPSIGEAITESVTDYLRYLENAQTFDDVRAFFTLFMSNNAAKKMTDILEDFMCRKVRDATHDAPPLDNDVWTAPIIELPGIGPRLANKLEDVGIKTKGELKRIGAVGAWKMIHEEDQAFPSKWVYTFEAALRGIRATELDDTLKESLKQDAETANPARAA